MSKEPIKLIGIPHFDPLRERSERLVLPGTTIREMVYLIFPEGEKIRNCIKVFIGEWEILRDCWGAKPKEGTRVVVRLIPGDNATTRSVLSVVVTVAAISLGQFYAAPLAAAIGVSTTTANAIITTSVLLSGVFLINTFLPVSAPGQAPTEATANGATNRIQGWRNVANPNGVIPELYGYHRFAPPYAVLPYSELHKMPDVGDLNDRNAWLTSTTYAELDLVFVTDGGINYSYWCIQPHTSSSATQPRFGGLWPDYWVLLGDYVAKNDNTAYAAFCGGYGEQEVSDVRIGNTPIGDFTEVETEIKEGTSSDTPLTLITEQIIEQGVGIELPGREGPAFSVVRQTLRDVTRVEIDLFFPQGLFYETATEHINNTVVVTIKFKQVDESTFGSGVQISFVLFRNKPFGHTEVVEFPSRDDYDIEITRTVSVSLSSEDINVDQVNLVSYKNVRPEYPIAFDSPLVLIAVKIKASELLNGVLDQLNYLGKSVVKDWNGSTWVNRTTNNPASLFRRALQSPATRSIVRATDSEIDLDALQDWHEYCDSKNLAYNRVHDFEGSLWEILTNIAAAGRARPEYDGVKWTVIIDKPQTNVIDHISPNNSWDFEMEKNFPELPDAFIASFKDETLGYQNSEMVIPRPGEVRKGSKSALDADLAWASGTRAEVYGDSNSLNDGVYTKVGSSGSGSWVKTDPETLEQIELPGKTHPDEIWKEARWRWYQIINRPNVYRCSMDWQHMILARGSNVRLSQNVLDRLQVATKVVSVNGNVIGLLDEITMETGESYVCRFRSVNEDEDEAEPPILSYIRTVQSEVGTFTYVTLTGSGNYPSVGDHVFFGLASQESFDLIVQNIERGDNLTARLTLLDHAPEIEGLVDDDDPPPWDGRVGEEL